MDKCKPVRNEVGVLLRSAEEEMNRWREHFQTVLNYEKSCSTRQRWSQVTSLTSVQVASHVLKSRMLLIKKLKNGKAAGCDNIPPEAIKAGGETSEEALLDLCNKIWREEKIPEE